MTERVARRPAAAEDAGSASSPDRDVVIDYVADMCRELALMARRSGEERMASLLELAEYEAGRRRGLH